MSDSDLKPSSNIYLIGMPGSGKSVTGRLLAKHFGYSLIDLDDLIEKKSGRIIRDIFEESGENTFRDLETDALREISEKENQVVATGGGIILRDLNWELMEKTGKTVYLKTSPEWILKRTAHTDKRPLLNKPSREKAIQELYEKREPLYEKADYVCTTDDRSPKKVALEIESKLNER